MTVVVWTNESTAMFLNSQPIPDYLILDPKPVRSEPPSSLCKSAGPDMSETRIHTARSTHLYQSPVPAKNTGLTRFSPSPVAGRRSWSWVLGIQWVHGPGVVRLLYMLSDSEPGKEPLVAALTIKGAISSRGTERANSKAAIVTASEHRSMEATWEEIVTFRNRLKFGEVESECCCCFFKSVVWLQQVLTSHWYCVYWPGLVIPHTDHVLRLRPLQSETFYTSCFIKLKYSLDFISSWHKSWIDSLKHKIYNKHWCHTLTLQSWCHISLSVLNTVCEQWYHSWKQSYVV